jgi:hypothetical protein
MSLINDALKRAKQAQQENPPPTPPLEFRPVEPTPETPQRTTLLVIGVSLVLIALLGLTGMLVSFISQSKSVVLPVAARVMDPPAAASPQTTAPEIAPEKIVTQPESPATTPAYIERPDEPNTNGYPVVAAIAEALKPAPLKLQGIFFNPQNPSAVLNSRTLYLGDRVNGFRVMAISPVAVTLVSATETNVLSLSGQ